MTTRIERRFVWAQNTQNKKTRKEWREELTYLGRGLQDLAAPLPVYFSRHQFHPPQHRSHYHVKQYPLGKSSVQVHMQVNRGHLYQLHNCTCTTLLLYRPFPALAAHDWYPSKRSLYHLSMYLSMLVPVLRYRQQVTHILMVSSPSVYGLQPAIDGSLHSLSLDHF